MANNPLPKPSALPLKPGVVTTVVQPVSQNITQPVVNSPINNIPPNQSVSPANSPSLPRPPVTQSLTPPVATPVLPPQSQKPIDSIQRPVVVASNNPIQAVSQPPVSRGPSTPSPVLQELSQAKNNQAPSQVVFRPPVPAQPIPVQQPKTTVPVIPAPLAQLPPVPTSQNIAGSINQPPNLAASRVGNNPVSTPPSTMISTPATVPTLNSVQPKTPAPSITPITPALSSSPGVQPATARPSLPTQTPPPQISPTPVVTNTLPPSGVIPTLPPNLIAPKPVPTQLAATAHPSQQTATVPPTAPGGIIRPPANLSALSSMTSNTIPASGVTKTPPPVGGIPAPASSPNITANPKIPAQGSSGPQPAVAKPGLPMKMIAIIAGVLLLLGIIGFAAWSFLAGSGTTTTSTNNDKPSTPAAPSKQVAIEYWGLWEPSSVMDNVFNEFEKQNPGVTINYRQQSSKDYRTRLETAIASGNGPDLFRFHASWVPMLKDELAPMPNSVMDVATYQKTFYPIATYQLQFNGQIVGIPLMYDGLALYYNEDIFKTADIQPAKTWSELQTQAVKLTVKQNNRIQRAGIALGNAENVEHFSDVIALLMLQNGADLRKPNSAETRDALLFYVNFVKQLSVWDTTLPSSTVAFARGDAAMMIAPSWRAFEIQQANPDLKFGMAPVPQLPESTRITWGTYWAEGVNNKGKNKDVSWALLKYMSSATVMKQLHADQAKVRSFGEIYSRTDLAEELAANPKLEAFLQDAPYAQSGYLNSYTHDAGVNDQLIQYYKDAVNALLQGKKTEDVLDTLDKGTQQVLRQYSAE